MILCGAKFQIKKIYSAKGGMYRHKVHTPFTLHKLLYRVCVRCRANHAITPAIAPAAA